MAKHRIGSTSVARSDGSRAAPKKRQIALNRERRLLPPEYLSGKLANRKKGAAAAENEFGAAEKALRNSIIFNLVTLTNLISTAQSQMLLNHFDIGVASMRTMAVLRLEPGILPARICEVTTMDKSVVSRILNSLEESGYVERQSIFPNSRKQKWSLTEKGSTLQQRYMPDTMAQQALLLEGLSENEKKAGFAFLWRLRENIEALQNFRPQDPKPKR